jgi:hypothetical protein
MSLNKEIAGCSSERGKADPFNGYELFNLFTETT